MNPLGVLFNRLAVVAKSGVLLHALSSFPLRIPPLFSFYVQRGDAENLT
jgi:hypothetical protein